MADGEIVDVGSGKPPEIEGSQVRDLSGATIIPGLIDAHGHIMGLGYSLLRVDLVGAKSKSEVLERLQAFEARLPEEAWLTGRGWDQNDWPEKQFPDRDDLDAAFPDRPVWLTRIDGHAGWANSAAMRQADREFDGEWQPEGGLVVRDATGRATGIFVDGAMAAIEQQVPPPSTDESRRAFDLALKQLASVGLTSVHEAGTSKAAFDLYRSYASDGELTLRIYAMADGDAEMARWLCENGTYTSPMLVARSIKLYADGALGSRGAALLEPYSDDAGNRGLLFEEDSALAAKIDRAMECGLQVNTHAIGDRANRVVLDAYAAAMKAHDAQGYRHRIEHAQVVSLEDIPRFARLDIIASMQPTHATSDMYWAQDRVGEERIKGAYAWQRFLDAGAKIAFGSDFPVEKSDPLIGFYAAVTRQDLEGWPEGGWRAQEKLTREQTLKAFTLDAAYAAFMEAEVGSIEPGKRADFVVLSADPTTVPADKIVDITVMETVVDGKTVFTQ